MKKLRCFFMFVLLFCLQDLHLGHFLDSVISFVVSPLFQLWFAPICRCPGAPCLPFVPPEEVPKVFDVLLDEDCFRRMVIFLCIRLIWITAAFRSTLICFIFNFIFFFYLSVDLLVPHSFVQAMPPVMQASSRGLVLHLCCIICCNLVALEQ
ncbi:hypothetical protein ACQJBY_014723 [Aegilops geniculata]